MPPGEVKVDDAKVSPPKRAEMKVAAGGGLTGATVGGQSGDPALFQTTHLPWPARFLCVFSAQFLVILRRETVSCAGGWLVRPFGSGLLMLPSPSPDVYGVPDPSL